jgi:HD superfamily phosphohydrolase
MRMAKIITDPIYQVMNFGSDPKFIRSFKRVIDTKAFQRLRRITQLGLASYVFPGATHTRFSHSLGVANLARLVLLHLKEGVTGSDRQQIEKNFNSVLLAALLHDVGHGPFSHSFERVLGGQKHAPKHEDWTATLISHEDSEISQVLRSEGADVESISSVFSTAAGTSLWHPLKEVVSSQVDVDRMDYLVRDSHFAGLNVGRFDVNYLIYSLTVVEHGTHGPVTLGLTPKGVKAYEAFLLARQLMNRTLYYHHAVRVLEFMMERFLRLVIEELGSMKDSARNLVPAYLKRLAENSNPSRKEVFMAACCGEYTALTEDSIWTMVSAAAENRLSPRLVTPADQILTRKILPNFRVKSGKLELLREALVNGGLTNGEDFYLLDYETTLYKSKGDQRVFVRDEEGHIDEIPKHSETISVFRDRPEVEPFLVVLDSSKEGRIKKVAQSGQFIGVDKNDAVESAQLKLDLQRMPPSREKTSPDVSPTRSLEA